MWGHTSSWKRLNENCYFVEILLQTLLYQAVERVDWDWVSVWVPFSLQASRCCFVCELVPLLLLLVVAWEMAASFEFAPPDWLRGLSGQTAWVWRRAFSQIPLSSCSLSVTRHQWETNPNSPSPVNPCCTLTSIHQREQEKEGGRGRGRRREEGRGRQGSCWRVLKTAMSGRPESKMNRLISVRRSLTFIREMVWSWMTNILLTI